MNRAIREAAESFNDHRIQYVDVDPGFQGHRFCEPGDIQETQFNKNSKVWFWNQPTKWYVTIFDGDKSTTYDDDKAPSDILLKLIGFPVKTEKLGDEDVYVFHNPDFPQLTMEFRARVDGSDLDTQNGGKIARTLHPTQDGHKAMGDIVSKWLAIYHGRTSGPIQLPGSCPAGCKCNGIVPVCT